MADARICVWRRADSLASIVMILESRNARLARFRALVNRNAFLIGWGEYSHEKREEHLLIGISAKANSDRSLRRTR